MNHGHQKWKSTSKDAKPEKLAGLGLVVKAEERGFWKITEAGKAAVTS